MDREYPHRSGIFDLFSFAGRLGNASLPEDGRVGNASLPEDGRVGMPGPLAAALQDREADREKFYVINPTLVVRLFWGGRSLIDGAGPGSAVAVVDFAEIEQGFLNRSATCDTTVFHNAPVAVSLAVFESFVGA
jgi:hypothetical protein